MDRYRPRLIPRLKNRSNKRWNTWFKGGWLFSIIPVIATMPVMADTANFGTISLSPGFESVTTTVSGYTGGSYSLSAISNRDKDSRVCIGFADPNPDHILVLEKGFSNLKVVVNSSGNDTTLLLQAPDGTVYCGDDTGRAKDASVEGKNLKAGNYKVWVGTFNPNVKLNYTLSVEQ